MDSFLQDLLSIKDVDQLIAIKEKIKNQVTEQMTWQQRIELYKQVKFINERLQELKVTS
jgi:hypothetical protein